MEGFKNDAYEKTKIYNNKIKRWHDNHISERKFEVGQKVLLVNSWLKLFLRKLKSPSGRVPSS